MPVLYRRLATNATTNTEMTKRVSGESHAF
jgi:hypothetical protein